jgi:nicotinic acid mononucleotide adenylyltransferase
MSAFNNDIIFTIGRMNPPTTGHMKLIEKMMVTALETNVKRIYIILSATVDHEKNPLECIDKRKLLLNFIIDKVKNNIIEKEKYTTSEINKINIEVICTNDPKININLKNPIFKTILFMIQENNPSNIQLIIGEDRIEDYNWMKKYLSEKVNFLTPIDVKRKSKDPEKEGMSATKMRNLAKDGHFEEFSKEMIPTGIDDEHIQEIYDTIRDTKIPESSKSRKTKRTSESTEKKPKKTKAGKKTYKKKRVINK